MMQCHWSVASVTYPRRGTAKGPETVTEFNFGSGVCIQYDPNIGGMYIYLPVRESVLSAAPSTETAQEDQVLVNLDRINGVLTGIEIVRAEDAPAV